MLKSLSMVAVAALVAGAFLALPGVTPQVAADTPQAMAKADRLPEKPIGAACSQTAWPYYQTNCMRDGSTQARPVRLVTADRLTVDPRLTATR